MIHFQDRVIIVDKEDEYFGTEGKVRDIDVNDIFIKEEFEGSEAVAPEAEFKIMYLVELKIPADKFGFYDWMKENMFLQGKEVNGKCRYYRREDLEVYSN